MAETIYKGRPPNPPPHRLSGTTSVVVRIEKWLHPHVFSGSFTVNGEVQSYWFIQVEEVDGYHEGLEGEVVLPNWVGGGELPASTPEERAVAEAIYPGGSEVVVSFPLRGREVRHSYPEHKGVLAFNGYLVHIDRKVQ